MKRKSPARRWLVAAAATAALVCGGVAYAAFPDTNVETYTGCLNVGGVAGQLGKVAVGANPSKACASTERIVHLGGGDITKVTAGTGLSGGGDNGAVTLGLDAAHSLPQSCASGQVAKSNGSNTWACADDANTTYAAGTGLDLSGTTFSVKGGYRLPQGCSDGQAPVRTLAGPADWGCASFANADTHCGSGEFATGIDSAGAVTCAASGGSSSGGPEVWRASNTGDDNAPEGSSKTFVTLSLPAGTFVVDATGVAADDRLDIAGRDGNDALNMQCDVSGGGTSQVVSIVADGSADFQGPSIPVDIHTVISLADPGDVVFKCFDFDGSDHVADAAMTALAVATLHG